MCALCVHTCKSCVCLWFTTVYLWSEARTEHCLHQKGLFACLGWQQNMMSKWRPILLAPAKPIDWQKSIWFQEAHILWFAPCTNLSLVQEDFLMISSLVSTRMSVMERSLACNYRSTVIPLDNIWMFTLVFDQASSNIFCKQVGLLEWCLFSHRSILFTNN